MRVALMVTCVADMFRPEAAEAAVRVLERAGYEVDVPLEQTCCGQPAWNAGYPAQARAVARNTLQAFRDADRVVSLAGSCTTMVRVFYRELFENSPEEASAAALAERTSELSELLAGAGEQPPSLSGQAGTPVTYHDSCHMLRELGVKRQPRELLAGRGADVREVSERCCGFGGTFSVKLPEVSVAMADDKLGEIEGSGARTVVGCDLSCLLHMEGRARRRGSGARFLHLAEYLDEGDGS